MFQIQTVGAVGLVGVNANRTDILGKDRRREPARVLEVLVEQDQLLMLAQTVPSLVSLSNKIKTTLSSLIFILYSHVLSSSKQRSYDLFFIVGKVNLYFLCGAWLEITKNKNPRSYTFEYNMTNKYMYRMFQKMKIFFNQGQIQNCRRRVKHQ